MKSIFLAVALCCGALFFVSCQKSVPIDYRIVSEKAHDPFCYIQGLEYSGDFLYESGGGYNFSTVRKINSKTGELVYKRPMASSVFAEGLTIFQNELWVITWKEGIAYVLNPETLGFVRSFRYTGEGWGLTHDEKNLIMSNGSSSLKFINPKDFSVQKTLTVMDEEREIDMLNELEYVDGEIYANIYLTDRIARISAETGKVTGWLDLSELRKRLPQPNHAEVLNGIARDPATGRFLITGKLWPKRFEIEIGK